MVTKLDNFRESMEPAKKLYLSEIRSFAKRYDVLGEMILIEEPDIDTMDYVFSFEKVNGTSQDVLDTILLEICNHMDEFSKRNGIEKFCQNTVILL